MRIVVVQNKNDSVSCLPVMKNKDHYEQKYKVVCYVNKLWNPYYVNKIKKYFKKQFTNQGT